MKILHRVIDSCMSCPFGAIERQPMDHVVADVAVPEWCPLPDADAQTEADNQRYFVVDGVCHIQAHVLPTTSGPERASVCGIQVLAAEKPTFRIMGDACDQYDLCKVCHGADQT